MSVMIANVVNIHWLIYPYVIYQIAPGIFILRKLLRIGGETDWPIFREQSIQARGTWTTID